jgi:hypothetical protein
MIKTRNGNFPALVMLPATHWGGGSVRQTPGAPRCRVGPIGSRDRLPRLETVCNNMKRVAAKYGWIGGAALS